MKALVYASLGSIELRDVPEPALASDHDVKIRMYGTGICGTDHKIIHGKLSVAEAGTILGHEGVGTVYDAGRAVTTVRTGDRVIINPTQSCGLCRYCRLGQYCYCMNFDDHQVGFSLPGTFAEYFVTNEKFLYRIPTEMSWSTASLIEPLGCSLNSVVKANLKPDDAALVIGCGPIGLLCQSIARRLCRLTVGTDPISYRRDFATSIADHAFAPEKLTEEVIRDMNGGRAFDVVIDAVGDQLETAMRLVAKGGRIVPMGYDETFTAEVKPTDLINNGVSLIGAVPLHDAIGPAIEFARSMPRLEDLVTTAVPIEEFTRAFDSTSESLKAIILS